MRNVFDQYSQPENRLTHALMTALHEDRGLLALFLREIAGARLQPTFLMADVEIIATYRLFNLGRAKLESLIHRIFAPARLDIEIMDRFGRPIVPEEWFLVPLQAIDDAVEKIKDGTISDYVYDPGQAALVRNAR